MAIDYLFDTNILIYLINNRLVETLPNGVYGYSVITEIELLSFSGLTETDMKVIRHYLDQISLVNLTEAVKQTTIDLRRRRRIKLPDAIIAATAIEADAVLLTNDKELYGVNSLKCLPLQVK